MKVQVENVDGVRKKVEVLIPDETIDRIRETIYEEVRKNAKIKGFRQGKIPKPIITQYYKEYIDDELKKRMVQETMYEALLEAKVEPILEPRVDFLERAGEHGYTLECEVLPEVTLPEYKGIEVEAEPATVSDEDIDKRIEGLQHMHAEVVAKEGEALAALGDFVVVKYQGYHNGEPLKEVAAESYPLELGNAMLMPEFENGVIGMREKEEKDIEIAFPEDYPDKNIASKKIVFKVTMKEVKQKRLPEVNNEFAKDLSFENVDALRQGVRAELLKEKEAARKRDITQKIIESLLKGLVVPVPERVLERRVQGMIEEAKSRYNVGKLSPDEMASIEARLKADFEKKAEERIKVEIVLARIAEKEGIKADEKDLEERIKKIAEDTNKTYNEVRDVYEQYHLMGSLRETVIEEKTVDFLRDSAVVKEKA
ncbi:MAG TPA: trigger factor [Syntrophorhabdaceae bacterium]|nr:trigger factor [Syntrophorhabdaceae bacterium]